MSYTGFVFGTTGLLCAIFAAVRLILGYSIAAWMMLLSTLLVLGGVQILFMGVLGEYLWRTLDEARRRPRFIIEDATPELERLARDDEFLS
jgi:polyisoprenyl-phosphate glycosyltransferase